MLLGLLRKKIKKEVRGAVDQIVAARCGQVWWEQGGWAAQAVHAPQRPPPVHSLHRHCRCLASTVSGSWDV